MAYYQGTVLAEVNSCGGCITYQGRSFSMLIADTLAGPVLVMIWV